MKLLWNLADFREWWISPARGRWSRVIRFSRPRDLVNFGDLR
jgi:hypothetical protein